MRAGMRACGRACGPALHITQGLTSLARGRCAPSLRELGVQTCGKHRFEPADLGPLLGSGLGALRRLQVDVKVQAGVAGTLEDRRREHLEQVGRLVAAGAGCWWECSGGAAPLPCPGALSHGRRWTAHARSPRWPRLAQVLGAALGEGVMGGALDGRELLQRLQHGQHGQPEWTGWRRRAACGWACSM
jgi:hypothetical protein